MANAQKILFAPFAKCLFTSLANAQNVIFFAVNNVSNLGFKQVTRNVFVASRGGIPRNYHVMNDLLFIMRCFQVVLYKDVLNTSNKWVTKKLYNILKSVKRWMFLALSIIVASNSNNPNGRNTLWMSVSMSLFFVSTAIKINQCHYKNTLIMSALVVTRKSTFR